MSGWTRLRIVLSAIYWAGGLAVLILVFVTLKPPEHGPWDDYPPGMAQSSYQTPAEAKATKAAGLLTDEEAFGPKANAPKWQDDPIVETAAEVKAEKDEERKPYQGAAITFGVELAIYAVLASLWWAFAGFRRPA